MSYDCYIFLGLGGFLSCVAVFLLIKHRKYRSLKFSRNLFVRLVPFLLIAFSIALFSQGLIPILALLLPVSAFLLSMSVLGFIVLGFLSVVLSAFFYFKADTNVATETDRDADLLNPMYAIPEAVILHRSHPSFAELDDASRNGGLMEELKHTLEIFKDLFLSGHQQLTESMDFLSIITHFEFKTDLEDIASLEEKRTKYHADIGEALVEKTKSILNNLSRSFEKIINDMKTQSLTLQYTFDAFDITTMSLERVEEVVRSAKDLARDLTDRAIEGTNSVRETVEGIQDISSAAKQMTNILKMLQKISEQTNVLAMNAAIVAAKAGQQGKGFAVVASEIRKLSQDSSKFTEAIYQIIREIDVKIDEAVIKSENTAQIFSRIKESIDLTNRLNQEVYEISRKNMIQGKEILTAVNQLKTISHRIVDDSMRELTNIKEAIIVNNDVFEILINLSRLLGKSRDSFIAGVNLINENIDSISSAKK